MGKSCWDDTPERGSRWVRIGCTSGRIIRVLGEAEGWIVARYKGAAPWVEHVNQWRKRFEPAPAAGRDALLRDEGTGR